MACKCIERVNELLAPHNTKLACTFPLIDNRLGMIPTIVTKLVEPKRGAKPMGIHPTFCPFCGVKYQESTDGTESVDQPAD